MKNKNQYTKYNNQLEYIKVLLEENRKSEAESNLLVILNNINKECNDAFVNTVKNVEIFLDKNIKYKKNSNVFINNEQFYLNDINKEKITLTISNKTFTKNYKQK